MTESSGPREFITLPPGLLPAAPAAPSMPEPIVRDGLDADVVLHQPGVVWRLDPPEGQHSIALTAAALLGRDPAHLDFRPDAVLVAITDAARSVSKTHALVEPDSDCLWVTDLGSTNGVSVAMPGAERAFLEPNTRSRVEDGAIVWLGDVPILVSRR